VEAPKQIESLYQEAIDSYKNKPSAPTSRYKGQEGILKILEFAKKERKCIVSLSYSWTPKNLQGPFSVVGDPFKPRWDFGKPKQPWNLNVRHAQAPAPYFTDAANKGRETSLTGKLQTAISNAIPNGIPEFGKGGNVEFRISATIIPSSMVYEVGTATSLTKTYYQGVDYDWHCAIYLKGERIYEFKEKTLPPQTFKVRYFRHKYDMINYSQPSASTVFEQIAESTLEEFSRKFSEHFGK
jgi:hypothetical protein